jgi:hypothetical protein
MSPTTAVVFVPYPVPVGDGCLRRCPPPPYPRQSRNQWPTKPSVPVRDLRQVRDMLADAKRMTAQDRASRLLPELDR